jgi:adenine-specific DNA-methyltransferase
MSKEIAKNGKGYSQFSKDDLIKIVEKLETRKKYGLIWDEEKVKEQFEKDAENALPVLKEISTKEITDRDSSKPVNILIEGDNYHALSVLNFTHQGKIDVIYIDPPYNTGAKDWKYNNDYVDANDPWRHSKWISLMNKRLKLSRSLLKDDGTIIVAIDDYELNTLGLLLDEIFPSHDKSLIVVEHHPQGAGSIAISRTHEYAYVHTKRYWYSRPYGGLRGKSLAS